MREPKWFVWSKLNWAALGVLFTDFLQQVLDKEIVTEAHLLQFLGLAVVVLRFWTSKPVTLLPPPS